MELLDATTPKTHPGKPTSEVPLAQWGLPPISKHCACGHPLLKRPLAPPTPTFLALLTGLWALAQDRTAGPLHCKGKEQPSSAPAAGIRALPAGRTNQPWLRRARRPAAWATEHQPPSLRPSSGLPSPVAGPSTAPGPPSSPFSRDTRFQSPTDGILVYIPVTKATEGHKALNYLGHVIPCTAGFPLPSP